LFAERTGNGRIEPKREHRLDVLLIDEAVTHAGDPAFGDPELYARLGVRFLDLTEAISGEAEAVAEVERDSVSGSNVDAGSGHVLLDIERSAGRRVIVRVLLGTCGEKRRAKHQ
jgi:hypothetical protein